MLQNAPNCIIQNFFSGKHAPKPPSKRMATPRVASPPPSPPKKIVGPLGKSCIRPGTTTEKFI